MGWGGLIRGESLKNMVMLVIMSIVEGYEFIVQGLNPLDILIVEAY
jgi:hypothetical protein